MLIREAYQNQEILNFARYWYENSHWSESGRDVPKEGKGVDYADKAINIEGIEVLSF